MQAEDLSAASVCITRAFVGTPEAANFSNVTEFLEKSLTVDPSKATCLVARAERRSDASINASAGAAPSSAQEAGLISRIVGCVSVSFTPETRDAFETLEPPPDGAYLSNMAVDSKFRRAGVARGLLREAEARTRELGIAKMYLHVTDANGPAKALYMANGFKEVKVRLEGESELVD